MEWISINEHRLWIGTDNGLSIVMRGVEPDDWLASLHRQNISLEEVLFNLGAEVKDASQAEVEDQVKKVFAMLHEAYA